MDKKLLFTFSLCQKAGKILAGDFAVYNAIKANVAILVIIADDASFNTQKKFKNKCSFYNIDYLIFGTKENISHAIGKINKSVFAITDEGLANKIKGAICNCDTYKKGVGDFFVQD